MTKSFYKEYPLNWSADLNREVNEMKEEVNTKAVKDSMNRIEALDKLKLVLADRGDDYGSPLDNHQIVADLFNVVLTHHKRADKLEAEDTMLLMILIKVARLCNSPEHIDSWLDMAGYSVCGIDAINERGER